MNRRHLLAAPVLLAGAAAQAADQPVVLELFTSQSSAACRPADELLAELAARPDVLALGLHVTYWDNAAWRDRYSLREADNRQRRYASTLAGAPYRRQVYTPQFVVQGQAGTTGPDRAAVLAALDAARGGTRVPVTVTPNTTSVTLRVGAGSGVATVWLIGFDARRETEVRGGENAGHKLEEVNVVRSITQVGAWLGQPLRKDEPKPEGERIAVLLQAAGGGILGAAKS